MKISVARNRRQKGQAMVESALVLLVVLAMLIGVLDFGQVVFIHQALSERVRNAARWGAINYNDPVGAKNMVLYGQSTVPTDPSREGGTASNPYLGLSPSMITVTRQDNDTNEDRVVVKIVNYPFRFFSPWIAGQYNARTITATAPVESN